MTDQKKDIPNEQLTQKDIVQLLLHNAQHMATREDVKSDINELKAELKSDINELKVEVHSLRDEGKADLKELRDELKADGKELRKELKADINLLNSKFDRMQWLIVATLLSVFLKDYILAFIQA